ncbi:MAG: ADP-ribosylglycohydrolase family protein, partial [Myxococcales bacterium]
MPSLRERITGCLLGGALGDALGLPYEGRPPTASPAPPSRLQLSDDTQLTLATAEGIVDAAGVDPAAIAARFTAWHRERRLTGLGASTLQALQKLEAGAHWALAGSKGEKAAGDGAAMRIAPVAFFCDPQTDAGLRTVRDVCRITHHHDEAFCGALAVVYALRMAASGVLDAGAAALLTALPPLLPDCATRERLEALAGEPPETPLAALGSRYGNSGWV